MRCFALGQVDGEAGRLLIARARPGIEPSWVHRCQLDHGHAADHRCVDSATDCTIEWDDSSTVARVVGPPMTDVGEDGPQGWPGSLDDAYPVDLADPLGGAGPVGDAGLPGGSGLLDPGPPSVAALPYVNGARHAADDDYLHPVVGGRTEAQSLDAIASALERIRDVVDALIGDSEDDVARAWRRIGSSAADRGPIR